MTLSLHRSIIQPLWPAPPHIVAGVTTRFGGCSKPPYDALNLAMHVGDREQDVDHNRDTLLQHLNERYNKTVNAYWLNQTHSNQCQTIGTEHTANKVYDADALTTRITGNALFVLTADCLPVLFSNYQGSVIGAAHAGWRGLYEGILDNCIQHLDSAPNALYAWLGPAIGPSQFEVGEDVLEAFVGSANSKAEEMQIRQAFQTLPNASLDSTPNTTSAKEPVQHKKYLADLYQLCCIRLRRLGVSHIYGGGFCTVNESRFYSYRRDGITGRMASFIFMNGLSE